MDFEFDFEPWYLKHQQTSNAIGAIIQAQDTGRIFLGLRSGSSDAPYTWCIAGGGIEEGETALEALAREIREEFNIVVSTSNAVPATVFKSPSKGFAYFTTFLRVPTEFLPTLNSEHVGWGWSHPDKLPNPLHPGFENTMKMQDVKNFLGDMR